MLRLRASSVAAEMGRHLAKHKGVDRVEVLSDQGTSQARFVVQLSTSKKFQRFMVTMEAHH